MKSFEKVTVTVCEPVWVSVNYSQYTDSFKKIRDNMKYTASSCFKCSKDFVVGENIGLACFKKIGNKVLCKECAEYVAQENIPS
jgi:hypothetical protein